MASHLRDEKDSRKLAAISVVAAGYAGDMPEELANVTPGTGTSVTLRGNQILTKEQFFLLCLRGQV